MPRDKDANTPETAFRWDPTAQQWIFNTKTGAGYLNSKNMTYFFQIVLIEPAEDHFDVPKGK